MNSVWTLQEYDLMQLPRALQMLVCTLSLGGTFISDTPNGKGKALHLKRGEYATIAYAPFDGKTNYTISLWIKDFGAGPIVQSYSNYMYGPSLELIEDMSMRAYTGRSSSYYNYLTFSSTLYKYQSETWTMVTVVTTTNSGSSSGISRLYINRQRVNAGTSDTNNNSGAIAMSIGSSGTDPMKIDNVRLYSVALTDEEVMEIYNSERK